MASEASWVSYCFDDTTRHIVEFKAYSEISDESNRDGTLISMDAMLPNDLLEKILAYLPVVSIFRAGSVCKRWNEIVSSERFLRNFSPALSYKPWYFMFTSSDEPTGYAYDHILRKWHCIDLPCIDTSNWSVASSCGLVCFMNNDSRSELYVSNPITKSYKRIKEPNGMKFSDYSALAISVNKITRAYTLSLVKTKQVPDNFFQWDLSVHVYNSKSAMWVTSVTEVLSGWRGGDESVICDGVLHYLIYAVGSGMPENRHGLITYNLNNLSSPQGVLMRSFIPLPCSLTCGRLMNLQEKLVMVGGIGKQDRADVIKGIGIWVLKGKEWQEISRMPHKFFQGFGEFDDVFASSGMDNLIYIQSYGSPALLVFNMDYKLWKWAQKSPVTKRFPLQLFTGFCFEPRLESMP